MTRFFLSLPFTCWVACASTPPPPDPFDQAKAIHTSPDGLLKLTESLAGDLTIKKSGIGYNISAKAAGMDLTCVVGGLAQVDPGALLYRALSGTLDAWSKAPASQGYRVDEPWVGVAGGYPVFGLRVNLKMKDGSEDPIPALVIAHHSARIYCVDSTSDDRQVLLHQGAAIAQGLLWKGKADHRLPSRSILYTSRKSPSGSLPTGYYQEGLGRDTAGHLHWTENSMSFRMKNAGQDLSATDFGLRQVTLPDGTLDEMTSAMVRDGKMVGSSTFQRLEDGSYRVTGVDRGKPVEIRLEAVKLTSRAVVQLWVKDQPEGATQTFLMPASFRPWTKTLSVTVTGVGEDGSRRVLAVETIDGKARKVQATIGPDGLTHGYRRQADPTTVIEGRLAD